MEGFEEMLSQDFRITVSGRLRKTREGSAMLRSFPASCLPSS